MFNRARNGVITLHRGDTFSVPLDVNIGTGVAPEWYYLKPPANEDIPEDRDTIFFALLEPNQKWENAIVKKMFTSDDINPNYDTPVLHFYAEDTEYLRPGVYYYQIKLLRSRYSSDDGFEHVDTVVPRTKFIILE